MAHAVAFPAAVPARSAGRRSTPARRAGVHESVRLTRRGRIVLGLVVGLVGLTGLGLVNSFVAQAGPPAADRGPATAVVVVQPGESLWQIAQQVAPQSDPRTVVTAIRELNQIGVRPIVPGQSLVIPVFG